MPHHCGGDLLHTMAISGHSRVQTKPFELAVVAASPPHPVQMHSQLARHGDFCGLASAPQRQVKEPAAPLRLAAYRHLCRFYQQITQQRVALFT
jgi:hypothetical protein